MSGLGWGAAPEGVLRLLLVSVLVLGIGLGVLILATGILQVQADRRNRRRIARAQAWEMALPGVLFEDGPVPQAFLGLGREGRAHLRRFLQKVRGVVGGREAEGLRRIYQAAGLERALERRLESRSARTRAEAALEVCAFGPESLRPRVVVLLDDPVPFVGHAAARALSRTGNLAWAEPLRRWIARQDDFAQERAVALLEDLGPGLLDELAERLAPPPAEPSGWRLFALLAVTHKPQAHHDRLLALLEHPDREVRIAALKAVAATGHPDALARLLPFATSGDPLLRLHAAKALGALGGTGAGPALADLLADPVFDVRRAASQGLLDSGGAGLNVLAWVSEDPAADPFARDMATERLAWARERGRL